MPDACFNSRDLTQAACMMIAVDTRALSIVWSGEPLELWLLYPWKGIIMCAQVANVIFSYMVNIGPYQNIDHV